MSAVVKPESEPPPDAGGDAGGWALLDSMRRKLDEQAAQGRRTQQQVGQLADSIAALVAAQRRRVRWLNLNSFVAYAIFTILCGLGAFMMYRSRARELESARETAEHERDAATHRADDATAKAAAREQSDAAAWEIYQLLDKGKRADAVAKLDRSSTLPLSKTERTLLTARAKDAQVSEADTAYKAAVTAFKASRFADVIGPLEAALPSEPPGARATAMHYYAGIACSKTNALEKAIKHLEAALAGDTDHEDARYELAFALDRSNALARARAEYDRFATAHPQSPLAAVAMRRSATIARMPGIAPAGGVAPAPPIAPAPAPVQQQPVPAKAVPVQPPAAKPATPTAPQPQPAAPTTPPGD